MVSKANTIQVLVVLDSCSKYVYFVVFIVFVCLLACLFVCVFISLFVSLFGLVGLGLFVCLSILKGRNVICFSTVST